MDIRQLTYFVSVVEQGSFTAAAEKLAIAQPSLSQQIMNLEEELGEPLLIRSRKGVELTEAGDIVLARAKRMIEEMDSLRSDFEARSETLEGAVQVGVIPTIAPFLLPGIVASFRTLHPEVRVNLREELTSDLLSLVSSGEVDFAITSDVEKQELQTRSLHIREIYAEALLLIAPASHPLVLSDNPVEITDLPLDELLVLSEGHCLADQIIKACRSRRPSEGMECGQLETLFSLIQAGLGISIIPEMAVPQAMRHGLVAKDFARPVPQRQVVSLRRRSARISPAAKAFFDHFHELARSRREGTGT